jgi:release factor glutamine methyltransferase
VSPVREAIVEAARVLAGSGVASPRVDAELLAGYVLGVPRGRLPLVDGFTPEQATRYRDLIGSRAARVPLQYLTGSAPFHHLDLAVGPGVFIPRPETELLAAWGASRLAGLVAPVVVDLCSGSGAIALAIAHERPDATVYAVEDSPAALDWLRRNASGTGVRVVAGDATDPATLSTVDGRVDLVLCNPPYVPSGTPVEPEVGAYDPARAVFGGPDGLAVIRPVIGRAAALLRPGIGWFGIEHDDGRGHSGGEHSGEGHSGEGHSGDDHGGDGHGKAVPELLRAARRFDAIEDHVDLTGRPRFTTARRLADSLP